MMQLNLDWFKVGKDGVFEMNTVTEKVLKIKRNKEDNLLYFLDCDDTWTCGGDDINHVLELLSVIFKINQMDFVETFSDCVKNCGTGLGVNEIILSRVLFDMGLKSHRELMLDCLLKPDEVEKFKKEIEDIEEEIENLKNSLDLPFSSFGDLSDEMMVNNNPIYLKIAELEFEINEKYNSIGA